MENKRKRFGLDEESDAEIVPNRNGNVGFHVNTTSTLTATNKSYPLNSSTSLTSTSSLASGSPNNVQLPKIMPALNPILMLTPRGLARKRQRVLQAMKLSPDNSFQAFNDLDNNGIKTWITNDLDELKKGDTIIESNNQNTSFTNKVASNEILHGPASSTFTPEPQNSNISFTTTTTLEDELDTPPPLETNLLNPKYESDDELDPPPELHSLLDEHEEKKSDESSTFLSPSFRADFNRSLVATPSSFSFEDARRRRREFIRSIEVLSEHRRRLKKSRSEDSMIPTTPTIISLSKDNYENRSTVRSDDSKFRTDGTSRITSPTGNESKPNDHFIRHSFTPSFHSASENDSSPFITNPINFYNNYSNSSNSSIKLSPPTQPQFTRTEIPIKRKWPSSHWERLTEIVEELGLDKNKDLTTLPLLPLHVIDEFSDFTALEVQRRALAIARQLRKSQLVLDSQK